MITCIVGYEINFGGLGVIFFNLFQQFPKGHSVDRVGLDNGQIAVFEIKRSVKVEPLATRCCLNRDLLTLLEPAISGTALILGMHGVQMHDYLTRKQ